MKVNLSIEMTDEQRRLLAKHIDGRSKPLASRKEVTATVMAYWEGLMDSLDATDEEVTAGTLLLEALEARGYGPGTHAAQQFTQGWFRNPSKC